MKRSRPGGLYTRALAVGQRFPGYAGLAVNASLAAMQLEDLEREIEGTRKSVWSSPLVPSEILAAFDLISVTPETVAAVLSSAGRGGALLEEGEAEGISGDCCSFQRAAIGALTSGAVPVPAAFVSTSAICDDNPQLGRYLARKFDRDFFLLDIPAGEDEAALAYALAGLTELIRFLESLTGRRLDPARLARAVEESNRARHWWREANRIRRDSPPVMYGAAALRLAGGMLLQKLGLPALTEAMEGYAGELAGKVSDGAFVPLRRRLLWLHLFPLYDRDFMKFVEVELGLVAVFEESSHVWWDEIDPGEPLPGIARRIAGNPLAGTLERRLEAILGLVREFRVDGVVNFSHLGCKSLTAAAPLIGRALRAEGVPFLEVSGDCLDNRGHGAALWRTRLEAFAEILG